MYPTSRKTVNQMEKEIIRRAKSFLGKNLVALLAEGSYGSYDFVEGYSDYDLSIFVKNFNKIKEINFTDISERYHIDIQCVVRSYEDFQNRVKNNHKATRFIGNLDLINIKKKKTRLLVGMNIANSVPDIKKIIKRDLGCELRAEYYHATNLNPSWNIYRREPRKWVNYIINLSDRLLLSKGVISKKDDIPKMLAKYYPYFRGIKYIREALVLRKTKRVLKLNETEKKHLKNILNQFLEEYKRQVFC
ncbi:MAG: hypothetical protein PHE59_03725 [Patescibacteria group bacterium]|nr:hypothetical protein [Patescibacteria group bacterium]MDD5164754.1 hypothetical protein [Patescibacteria group bacterium]MDD5534430.1 hypothetical protein [Patescibacteria group bacterium]